MRKRSILRAALCFAVMLSAGLYAQTAPPSTLERSALEIRANQEFNRAQYATALPMLRRLSDMSKDQPDLLGPIQEKIRVCEKNLMANSPAPTTAAASLSAGRTPHPAPKPGEMLDMPIKELGNFDFDSDTGGTIPPDVTALSGHPIRLHGFMIPIDQAANITQFALVPDLFSCCFGQPPQVQHTITVNCPKGKAVGYYPDEITVEGTLKVDEKKDDGFVISIFEIAASSVKPSAK